MATASGEISASAPRYRLRRALILVAAVAVVLFLAPTLYPFEPAGLGWTYHDRGIVDSVRPGFPLARAGVVPGDRVSFVGPFFRAVRSFATAPGSRVQLEVLHNNRPRRITVTEQEGRLSPALHVLIFFGTLLGIVYVIAGAMIAYRRPDAMGIWLFLLFTTFISTLPILPYRWLPDILAGPLVFTAKLWLTTLSPALLLPFLLYFPDGRLNAWKRRAAPYIWTFFVIQCLVAIAIVLNAGAYAIPRGLNFLEFDNSFLVALAILTADYMTSSPEARARTIWGFIGVPFIMAYIAVNLFFYNAAPLVSQGSVLLAAVALCAFGYAIVKDRMFDVTFSINRAIVYAILTISIAISITSLDWALGRLIGSKNLALAVDAAVAIGFGIILDEARRRVERVVDRTLFRARHAAEHRIRRIIASLAFAESSRAVYSAVTDEAITALNLASSALFLDHRGERYVREPSLSHEPKKGDLQDLALDDVLVRVLRAELAAVRLNEISWRGANVEDSKAPSIAVPLVVRNQLIGFVLYGSHANGLAIDPSEIALLHTLVKAAAATLDLLEARSLRQELEESRQQVRLLQHMRETQGPMQSPT